MLRRAFTLIKALIVIVLIFYSPAFALGEKDLEGVFSKVSASVGKAVVTIATDRPGRTMTFGPGKHYFKGFGSSSDSAKADPFREFFKYYFGNLPESQFKYHGLGSGVVIDKKGYVLTNQHIIEGSKKIIVVLSDGRSIEAKVLGEDSRNDLAILKIDETDLPYAELGNSDGLNAGQWAIAIGNPFGHIVKNAEPTVSVGIVTAVHQSLPIFGPYADRSFVSLIQTDAEINTGNSGGALCDIEGRVIGINVKMFTDGGGNEGLGFAIPINAAKSVLADLINGEKIAYGWLGIAAQDISKDMADYLDVGGKDGVIVSEVQKLGPAYDAGLLVGDIIRKTNGKPVKNLEDLVSIINASRVGERMMVDILRNKKEMAVSITVGPRPNEEVKAPTLKPAPDTKELPVWRGIKVASVTDDMWVKYGLKDRTGMVVVNVDPNSQAFSIGIRPGDVMIELNRKPIYSAEDFRLAVSGAAGSALVRTDRGYLIVKESKQVGS